MLVRSVLPVVDQFESRGAREGHRPVADAAGIGHGVGQRLEALVAEADAEKVADRRLDGGFGRAVPVDAQEGLAQGIAVGRRDLEGAGPDFAATGQGGNVFVWPAGRVRFARFGFGVSRPAV